MEAVRSLLLVIATLLGALGIALGNITPAYAVTCGDILGPGGRFLMDHDLDCGSNWLTVLDGAILNLNGHTVMCSFGPCIVLTGEGAQLLNGEVRGGLHEPIVLEGIGGHTVRNVTSTLVDANIIVWSDNNRLINVTAESAYNPAFIIRGNNNRLRSSFAICPDGTTCIDVSGDKNDLVDNVVSTGEFGGSGTSGIRVSGNNNKLRDNQITTNNTSFGIYVSGSGNDLRRFPEKKLPF